MHPHPTTRPICLPKNSINRGCFRSKISSLPYHRRSSNLQLGNCQTCSVNFHLAQVFFFSLPTVKQNGGHIYQSVHTHVTRCRRPAAEIKKKKQKQCTYTVPQGRERVNQSCRAKNSNIINPLAPNDTANLQKLYFKYLRNKYTY